MSFCIFFKPSEPDTPLSYSFWLVIVFLSLVKIWLVDAQNLTALGAAAYDDRLFLNIANALLNREWLGAYNNLTIVKAPFYPIWIASVFKLGVPLLLAQHLLYIAACIIFVISVKPLLRRPLIILLIFLVLLFNPMSYMNGVMTQVIREGIYPALTIFVVSCAIGLLVRYNSYLSIIAFWSISLGLALSAFWLTREEGIWIIPSILMVIGFMGFKIWKTRPVDFRKMFLLALPFVIWLITIGGVAEINKIKYSIFATSELKYKDFLAAYGALLRVKHDTWKPTVPVPKDIRIRIYRVSPSFLELKPFLEGDIGEKWGSLFKGIRERCERDPEFYNKVKSYLSRDTSKVWSRAIVDDEDIQGGWFVWAFRDAVAAAGYHTSGATAANYYHRLAVEVNTACSDGRLICEAERASLIPPWHNEYNYPLLQTVFRSAIYLARFEDFDPNPGLSQGQDNLLKLFRDLTGERLSPSQFEVTGLSEREKLKLNILSWIGKVYQSTIPFLTGLALIVYVVSGIVKKFRKSFTITFWLINTSLLIAIFDRLLILSMIHVTSFPAIIPQYLASSSPLLLMFVSLVLTDSFSTMRDSHLFEKLRRSQKAWRIL